MVLKINVMVINQCQTKTIVINQDQGNKEWYLISVNKKEQDLIRVKQKIDGT